MCAIPRIPRQAVALLQFLREAELLLHRLRLRVLVAGVRLAHIQGGERDPVAELVVEVLQLDSSPAAHPGADHGDVEAPIHSGTIVPRPKGETYSTPRRS